MSNFCSQLLSALNGIAVAMTNIGLGNLPNKYHINASVTGATYDFTDFELPNPHLHTELEINALIQVYRNNIKQTYRDTPTLPDEYEFTISVTENKLTPNVAYAVDKIEIYRFPL